MRASVPCRAAAIAVGAGIAGAACNVLTGISSLNELAGEAGSVVPTRDATDRAETMDAGRKALDAPAPDDAQETHDAGNEAACDDATLSSDPQNCGACGRSCGVEACEDASCEPRLLVAGLPLDGPIAVDSKSVYFLTSTTVDSVPIDGGPVSELATSQSNQNYIAVDSAYVYISVEAPPAPYYGPLERVPLTGGAVTTLAPKRVGPNQVTAFGGVLYWAEQGDGGDTGAIYAIPPDGGKPTVVIGEEVGPERLAIDSENVYFANLDWGGTTVVQASLHGGLTITLASVDIPLAVAVDSSNVYFSNIGDGGSVYQVPKGGGTVIKLATTPRAIYVASDGTNVYFTDQDRGTLNKVPVGGGSPAKPLLSGLASPVGLALDATSVYCSATGSGSIVRLNK